MSQPVPPFPYTRKAVAAAVESRFRLTVATPTVLAPMQDVTTLPFMRLISRYGAPDIFYTEYFRVHETSRLEPHILASITQNGSGRPVVAQIIGEDIPHIERTIDELSRTPAAGIDLNLGCPAPKVYRKNVGGGLLRDPQRVDDLLCAMRSACKGHFSVKMRFGFEDERHYDALLNSIRRHRVDLLTVHGRTVKQLYRPGVHYGMIAKAVRDVPCPVIANGDVSSVAKARQVLETTGCWGLMIGRHAIRNPWIFRQIREDQNGQCPFQPTLGDVRVYVDDLWNTVVCNPDKPKKSALGYLKKFLNFTGQSVDPDGAFLKAMRHSEEPDDLWRVCDRFLVNDGASARPFYPEPYEGHPARPNHEAERETSCALFEE